MKQEFYTLLGGVAGMNALRHTTVQPIRSKNKIEEIKQLLRQQSYRDYFLFVMGINCGLRISDMLLLKVKDVIEKEHLQLREGKTDKYKKFRINAALQSEIAMYVAGMYDEDYLFPSRKGIQPHHPNSSLSHSFERCKTIGHGRDWDPYAPKNLWISLL